MSKHAPGPWSIERRHDGRPFGISAPLIAKSDVDCVCEFGMNAENVEANANLIAAAPDMLKALQLVDQWMVGHCPAPFSDQQVLEVVNSAIDKAQGN